jgi:hypothetical protein
VKVKLCTFRLQVVSLLRHVFFNESLLLNFRNRFVNSNNCLSLADLRLFALPEADISAAWKNNGLGCGFASYSHFCDYDSFVSFSIDSGIHRSTLLRHGINYYFDSCSPWHNSCLVWCLVCNFLALSRLEGLL